MCTNLHIDAGVTSCQLCRSSQTCSFTFRSSFWNTATVVTRVFVISLLEIVGRFTFFFGYAFIFLFGFRYYAFSSFLAKWFFCVVLSFMLIFVESPVSENAGLMLIEVITTSYIKWYGDRHWFATLEFLLLLSFASCVFLVCVCNPGHHFTFRWSYIQMCTWMLGNKYHVTFYGSLHTSHIFYNSFWNTATLIPRFLMISRLEVVARFPFQA